MKVSKELKFVPITITIENEEEAKLLWAMMNMTTKSISNEHYSNDIIIKNIEHAPPEAKQ